jgi:Zn-finger nucleic acid-binding protein
MIVVEHNQIELDYCTECHGVWFDSEELELLLDIFQIKSSEHRLQNLLQAPESETQEKKRKCPICGRKMNKNNIGRESEILIDVCPYEDGLWFDGGEVSHLLKSLAEKSTGGRRSEEAIVDFLGETLKAEKPT